MLFIQPTRELEPCDDDDDDWFMGMDIYIQSLILLAVDKFMVFKFVTYGTLTATINYGTHALFLHFTFGNWIELNWIMCTLANMSTIILIFPFYMLNMK